MCGTLFGAFFRPKGESILKLVIRGALACLLTFWTCASVGAVTSLNSELERACQKSDVARIAILVKEGANPNGVGAYRGSPLYLAIKSNDFALVRLLLTKGADPNLAAPGRGCGPLEFALDASLPILRSLLVAGANPNCGWAEPSGGGDQSLSTPLMAAAALKGLRMGGKRLAWTDQPTRKDTPRPAEVIRLLLEFGAKPNTRDFFGRNALYYAIDADAVDVARALIDGGLDVNAKLTLSTPGEPNPYMSGQTALAHALMRYDLTNEKAGIRMIGMLLEKGADPNIPPMGSYNPDCGHGPPPCGFIGETPLSYVAKRGYFEFARLLLEHGAKPDEPRADGALPAKIAALAGHVRTEALIERYEKH